MDSSSSSLGPAGLFFCLDTVPTQLHTSVSLKSFLWFSLNCLAIELNVLPNSVTSCLSEQARRTLGLTSAKVQTLFMQ